MTAEPQLSEVVPPADGEPQETGWDRRRRRIAEDIEGIALELFAAHGYKNVTLAEVAVAAGVSTRTITRYFPVKEDLLLSMPRRSVTGAIDGLRAAWREGQSLRDLWDIWGRLARENAADVQRLTLFWQVASEVPEVLDRARGEQHQRVRSVLRELVREALDDDPEVELHAHVVAAALQAANGAVVEQWMRGNWQGDLSEAFNSAAGALARELGTLDRPRPRRRRRPAART